MAALQFFAGLFYFLYVTAAFFFTVDNPAGPVCVVECNRRAV